MSTLRPDPVQVADSVTGSPVDVGDAADKAIRVNVVAGGAAGNGTSSSFNAPFPASGTAAGAQASAAAPTYIEGQMVALSVDLAGTLRTTAGGAGSGSTSINDGVTSTTKATVTGANALKVDGSAATQPVSGTVAATQGTAAALASKWPVQVTDGTNTMPTGDTSARTIHTTLDNASIAITAASMPLPSGAATSSLQTQISGQLPAALDGGGFLKVHEQGTAAISAASLPLPSGASTETTLGTRLADSTFTGRINTQGQKAMAASTPVVIASDQGALPVTGTFFQSTQPVSGTFFQSTQPVSAVSLPLPTGAALEGGNLAAIASTLTSGLQITSNPLPPNAALESGGNLAISQRFLSAVLSELQRHTVLLSALVAATGNHVPDQDEIGRQIQGDNSWPQ